MEMPMEGWPPGDTINNSAEEIAAANYPNIRLFSVPLKTSFDRIDNCEGKWNECTPENVRNFSATAYFFGRKIHQELDVPVGLIHSSWGGSSAEAWVSKEHLQKVSSYSGIENKLILGFSQYDSLLHWMTQLATLPVEGREDFYKDLDFVNKEFTQLNYNDSSWPEMEVPSYWNGTALDNFDGIVCFRREFTLPAALTGKDLNLELGPIDDMDDTYINGKRIGETLLTGFWGKERIYKIPAELMTPDLNVLTVYVIDNMSGGGMCSSSDIKISDPHSGKSVILNGTWKYMPVAELLDSRLSFYNKQFPFESRPELSLAINNNTPTLLFNAMINPILPFTLKGVIWYQGETNVGRGYEYRTLFPTLIECWRSEWEQGDFPFYFAQLASWENNEDVASSWAELREAQLLTLSVPNTGMAVITDLGSLTTIHPGNKKDVGERLALWALAKDYGYDSLVFSGPIFESIEIKGDKAIILFKYSESGLTAKNGALTDFEIAGNDQVYQPAHAEIIGNSVVVTSDMVKEPVAVRFGWSDIAEPNLFNNAGLPASPFRTDNWKRLSE